MTIAPLGDSAVVLTVGPGLDETLPGRVRAIAAALSCDPPRGVTDIVPAFATITVFYDLALINGFARFCERGNALSFVRCAAAVRRHQFRTLPNASTRAATGSGFHGSGRSLPTWGKVFPM